MTLRNLMASLSLSRNVFEGESDAHPRIRVFTSKRCEFSKVALEHVRFVVHTSKYRGCNLEVIEENIDDNIAILEAYNIMALPITVVGDYYLLGVPSTQDLESVLNRILCK
ncbi:MAG: hypothetical protein ACW98Y_10705 [Candidatus Thorarchaeota archaeon]